MHNNRFKDIARLLKYMKIAIVAIALVKLAFDIIVFVEPIIRPEGLVTKGSYRGLAVGNTKAEITSKLRSSYTRLHLSSYYVEKKGYIVPTVSPHSHNYPPLFMSNSWVLSYPGIHRELIVLTFKDDYLLSIKFRRDAIEWP